jgi:Flp pilus assembly pilin Flp
MLPNYRHDSEAIYTHAERRSDRMRCRKEKAQGDETENHHHPGKGLIMNLLNSVKSFAKDENGAVTVDWVVLTAGIVGLGILVIKLVGPGIEDLAGNIASKVSSTTVGYTASTAP